jgi:hypothetical protein
MIFFNVQQSRNKNTYIHPSCRNLHREGDVGNAAPILHLQHIKSEKKNNWKKNNFSFTYFEVDIHAGRQYWQLPDKM